MKHIPAVMALLVETGAWKATKYVSSKEVQRVTRCRYLRSRKVFSAGHLEFIVHVGRPNYAEREFIKACQKSGEAFPVKKIQLKYLPKARKA